MEKKMVNPSPHLSIMIATSLSDELYQACLRLIPQLTHNNPPPTHQELALLLESVSSTLFIARHPDFSDAIIGLATLILYRVPTGLRAYIEDVVVDEPARGRGIGEALTRACIERAREAGVSHVSLTSNPTRVQANRLYQHMGFQLRHTNVYRYDLNER
jgi:ribosomal protein S18 acetylase RimI-like enzyme